MRSRIGHDYAYPTAVLNDAANCEMLLQRAWALSHQGRRAMRTGTRKAGTLTGGRARERRAHEEHQPPGGLCQRDNLVVFNPLGHGRRTEDMVSMPGMVPSPGSRRMHWRVWQWGRSATYRVGPWPRCPWPAAVVGWRPHSDRRGDRVAGALPDHRARRPAGRPGAGSAAPRVGRLRPGGAQDVGLRGTGGGVPALGYKTYGWGSLQRSGHTSQAGVRWRPRTVSTVWSWIRRVGRLPRLRQGAGAGVG